MNTEITIENQNIKLKETILILMLTALMCVSSYVKITVFPVPVTMQIFVVALSGFMLKSRKAVIPLIMYLIYGISGAFVFANGGGIGYLLSPTFGYVIGFIAMAYVIGAFMEKQKENTYIKLFAIGMLGVLVCYIFGVIYLYSISNILGGGIPVIKAIYTGSFIFLPYDMVKIAVAILSTKKVKRRELDNE